MILLADSESIRAGWSGTLGPPIPGKLIFTWRGASHLLHAMWKGACWGNIYMLLEYGDRARRNENSLLEGSTSWK